MPPPTENQELSLPYPYRMFLLKSIHELDEKIVHAYGGDLVWQGCFDNEEICQRLGGLLVEFDLVDTAVPPRAAERAK